MDPISKDSQITRDMLLKNFKADNVDARLAKEIQNRSIKIPSYYDMNNEDQDRVINVTIGLLDV